MRNLYFDLYQKLKNNRQAEVVETLELNYPFSDYSHMKLLQEKDFFYAAPYAFRSIMVKLFAWAVTDPEALSAIVEVSKDNGVLEIGAGSGYWASLLSESGVDVVAYDNNAMDFDVYHYFIQHEEPDWDFMKDRNSFLCWPLYDDSMAYDCVKKYKGNAIIYIGEDREGCNANKDFFNYIYDNFNIYKEVSIEQWDGLHDNLCIFKK